MVTFRLPNTEYESIKTVLENHGASSISDLARSAVRSLLARKAAEAPTLEERLDELIRRVNRLEQRFNNLGNALQAVSDSKQRPVL
jgi:Arc/MetJ-type ribon-helix-helix transcriptional regulator